MTRHHEREGVLDLVVIPRTSDLGDNFEVRRALPSRQRRMVGPFVFLDQMGPHVFASGVGLDVRPHPHIGLATVTYLFDGELLHRDSLGTVQQIVPGEVNWMTAGRGIVHSERTGPEVRQQASSLFGIQCWVALPKTHEETEPSFVHEENLPVEEGEGISARIIAGRLFEKTSPVPTLSAMFYADVRLQAGAKLSVPAEYVERAIYIVEGTIDLGCDGIFDTGRLLVLKPGKNVTLVCSSSQARVMLLGGEPMDGPRAIVWNFVSSSTDRIQQAQEDWKNQRFPKVPEEVEFIPLPDSPGKPIFYP